MPFVISVLLITLCCLIFVKPEPLQLKEEKLSLPVGRSVVYMLLFALALLLVVNENTDLLPMAFDSGGVTTGPITVPFIMALGVGISNVLGDRRSKENSFGLVALCSVGPVLAVLVLGIYGPGYDASAFIYEQFLHKI